MADVYVLIYLDASALLIGPFPNLFSKIVDDWLRSNWSWRVQIMASEVTGSVFALNLDKYKHFDKTKTMTSNVTNHTVWSTPWCIRCCRSHIHWTHHISSYWGLFPVLSVSVSVTLRLTVSVTPAVNLYCSLDANNNGESWLMASSTLDSCMIWLSKPCHFAV